MQVPKEIRGFVVHGFVPHTRTGTQYVGSCPLCGKRDHFYVHRDKRLWDCKRCGERGNWNGFLRRVSDRNERAFRKNKDVRLALARERGLPVGAFKEWGIGWDRRSKTYTIRVTNSRGRVCDLRLFKCGGKVRSTTGASVGLCGWESIAKHRNVYVCEGEWDAIALRWLMAHPKVKQTGAVVCTPGASTFKADWAGLFKGKTVAVMYDNDAGGERGELVVAGRLTGYAKSVSYVHWPTDCPTGWDVRDWILHGARELKTPRACFDVLRTLLDASPRLGGGQGRGEATTAIRDDAGRVERQDLGVVTRPELVATFKKWLHMESEDMLALVCGTIFANRIEGDPIWMFLVAPPGGAKSETLMTLGTSSHVHMCSSLTPHALVSGMNMGGGDPSLLPQLDGRVLVIKDMTTVLTMHPTARDEIFGQLRDAYDGQFEKAFGNGVHRKYTSKFGILAGVTPNIDSFASLSAGLGERFLKYRVPSAISPVDEYELISRAMSNVASEDGMRNEMRDCMAAFLEQDFDTLPVIDDEDLHRIVNLAMLAARMRGVVERDRYNPNMIITKPSREFGTRLAKQLKKLAMGLGMYFDGVDADVMRIVTHVTLGSVPDKIEEVVRCISEHSGKKGICTGDIVEKSVGLTRSTTFRVLQDLAMLHVVRNAGKKNSALWLLSPDIKAMLAESNAFEVVPRRTVGLAVKRRNGMVRRK